MLSRVEKGTADEEQNFKFYRGLAGSRNHLGRRMGEGTGSADSAAIAGKRGQ